MNLKMTPKNLKHQKNGGKCFFKYFTKLQILKFEKEKKKIIKNYTIPEFQKEKKLNKKKLNKTIKYQRKIVIIK